MATFLVRALDLPPVDGNRFADVSGTHMANINALAEAGITLGCNSDGTLFCPDDGVTRAQMASFLARALDLPASETDWFTDDDGLSHESNINAVADAGITLGCGTKIYCPADLVPRDQMASFLARALGLDPIIPPPTTTTTTTTVAPTTTTAAPTTTTTQLTTTTTTEPPWEEFTVEGSGDDVIDLVVRGDDRAILSITYEGGRNFIVWRRRDMRGGVRLLTNVPVVSVSVGGWSVMKRSLGLPSPGDRGGLVEAGPRPGRLSSIPVPLLHLDDNVPALNRFSNGRYWNGPGCGGFSLGTPRGSLGAVETCETPSGTCSTSAS